MVLGSPYSTCEGIYLRCPPLVDAGHVFVDVLDVVLRREELVEVADGGQQLVGQERLSRPPLTFLEHKDNFGTMTKVRYFRSLYNIS